MTALAASYQQQFESKTARLPAWLNEIQAQAFAAYNTQGLPTRKTEQWKYSNLEALKSQSYQFSDMRFKENTESEHVQIIDGEVAIPNALPSGVQILSLSDALTSYQAQLQQLLSKSKPSAHCFENINRALMQQGLVVVIEQDTLLEKPLTLEICHQQANTAHQLAIFYLVAAGAKAMVVENYHGAQDSNYFINQSSHVLLEQNANLTHIKVIEEGADSHHISKLNAVQQRASTLCCHSFAFNGGLVRSDIESDLMESESHIEMNGLYVTSAKQHVAHYTKVNHLCPHASSDELYKGVLGGASQAVFNGTVYVEKDAQKTNAAQQNKNLLLSKQAEIDTKPQLEIYADDVKCAHGATVGQLEEKALFYLQSRGISKAEAVSLLINGFAGDLIEKLGDAHVHLKEKLHQRLENYLRQAYGIK